MLNKVIKLSTIALGVMMLNTTIAGELNTTFKVSAVVEKTCNTLTATALDFGTYNPLDGAGKRANSQIQVTCTNGTPYTVALSAGNHPSDNKRQMQKSGGSETLRYNLYSDSGFQSIWGDGKVGKVKKGQGTGQAAKLTVFGQIDANQRTAAQGAYNDTITVTVEY